MKILFVSSEFEEQARGITGIIKAMIAAAKADGHEVGILAGYPRVDQGKHELLDLKVEHLYLQHYLETGRKNVYPKNLAARRMQAKIIASRDYLKASEIKINHDLISKKSSIANNLDYIIKIPYAYYFVNNGMGGVAKRTLKKALKKHKIDLVVTGAPMDIAKKDVAPSKLIQFVHDTMPLDLLETPAENDTPKIFARQFYAAATGSDVVLTNSVDTEHKVKEVCPEAVTRVLYGVASSRASQFKDNSYLARKGLEANQYLLFISVIERRKNLHTLLDAYMKARKDVKMPLVIVGGKGFGYEDIMKHYQDLPKNIKNDIIFTGFISESEKYALLNNARAFIFPSLYEGIGLPVIEAFSSGLPVLTSRRGALPEAGGDAALYVEDPYDVEELAAGIVKVSNDEKTRSALKRHMKKQVDKFSVENFNKRFSDSLREL